MCTIVTHALVTAVLSKSVVWSQPKRMLTLSALCGVIPDLDGVGFHLGVPYLHVWGHRGATHSFSFALALGLLFGLLWGATSSLRGRLGWGLLFSLLIATHPLLDMLTTGGHGVALWAPFEHTRHFFSHEWRVIRVSPMSLSPRLKATLLSELQWVWAPTITYLCCVWGARRFRSQGERPT